MIHNICFKRGVKRIQAGLLTVIGNCEAMEREGMGGDSGNGEVSAELKWRQAKEYLVAKSKAALVAGELNGLASG